MYANPRQTDQYQSKRHNVFAEGWIKTDVLGREAKLQTSCQVMLVVQNQIMKGRYFSGMVKLFLFIRSQVKPGTVTFDNLTYLNCLTHQVSE